MADDSRSAGGIWAFIRGPQGWPYLLTPFIPAAIGLQVAGASAGLIFAVAALGIIPTAALMGLATEELAARSGPGIGGLLNVTFGNAPELIIALFALGEGLHEVVKASIVGSIIGNVLLVMGAAMFVGGIGREHQEFRAHAATAQASMLFLAGAALVMPAIFELVEGKGLPQPSPRSSTTGPRSRASRWRSRSSSSLTYCARACCSRFAPTSDMFNPPYEEEETLGWSVRRSVLMLAIAGVAVGVMSEILVGSISEASESIGLSEFFIGVIVVAIVGNAAEHWVAVLVARKDKMDLAVNIAIGSSAQIALFVAPVLVLASFLIGPAPLPLVFNGFELGGVLFAILVANVVYPRRRVELVRGPAAARSIRDPRDRVLLA